MNTPLTPTHWLIAVSLAVLAMLTVGLIVQSNRWAHEQHSRQAETQPRSSVYDDCMASYPPDEQHLCASLKPRF